MDVTYATMAVRRQVWAAAAAQQGDGALWTQGMLLSLVASAETLQDLATTTSTHLIRLTTDPYACFRYSNSEAALFLYPIEPSGRPMATPLTRVGLRSVVAVQIADIR